MTNDEGMTDTSKNNRMRRVDRLLPKTMSEFIAGGADINQTAEPQLIRQHVEDNAFHCSSRELFECFNQSSRRSAAGLTLALNISDLFAPQNTV